MREDLEPARAWAKETSHCWADCYSVERLLTLIAGWKKAKRGDIPTGDVPTAPKARRKLSDVIAELAQAQERIAQDDTDFVALRDPLPAEVDARAAELVALAAGNDVLATEELVEIGRRYHWRYRDLVERESCGSPPVSIPAFKESPGEPKVAQSMSDEAGGARNHGNVRDSSSAGAASATALDNTRTTAEVLDEAEPEMGAGLHETSRENLLVNTLPRPEMRDGIVVSDTLRRNRSRVSTAQLGGGDEL